jgi:hypothetical protein
MAKRLSRTGRNQFCERSEPIFWVLLWGVQLRLRRLSSRSVDAVHLVRRVSELASERDCARSAEAVHLVRRVSELASERDLVTGMSCSCVDLISPTSGIDISSAWNRYFQCVELIFPAGDCGLIFSTVLPLSFQVCLTVMNFCGDA